MQCVIVCAGKGTRMQPLTEHTPKPLITVCGKPLLQHVVEALPPEIDELVLVVGYLQEQIRKHCGTEYLGKRVQYVEQLDYAGGTGDALLCAQDLVHGKFLFMYADDIHGKQALQEALVCDHAILGAYSDTPENFGVLLADEKGMLSAILEKPKNPPSHTVNIGGFVLDDSIFGYKVAVSQEHGELLVTDMITEYAKEHEVRIIMQDTWIPVGKPEDIAKAEAIICPKSN